MIVIVEWVLRIAPIGVFALAAPLAVRLGVGVLGALLANVAIVLLACVAFSLLFLYPSVALVGRRSPWQFAVAIVSAQPTAPAYEENDLIFRTLDGELLGTGAKRPNADQWIWGEQHVIKASRVKLNALGLARVNAARAAHGQPALAVSQAELAPLGAEAQARADLPTVARIGPICKLT